MSVTRVTPEAHVYQVQLLGHIMLVCPETFQQSPATINCDRWLRRTRGGNTVFVQPTLLPPEPAPSETQEEAVSEPSLGTVTETAYAAVAYVFHSLRPKPLDDRATD